MIDAQSMQALIEKQIAEVITSETTKILGDQQWLSTLENKIVSYVQDRINARFANVAAVPDLISAIQQSIRELFDRGCIPGLESYVSHEVIENVVHSAVETTVATALDNLTLDSSWLQAVESSVVQKMTSKVSSAMNGVDVDQLIAKHLKQALDRWYDRVAEDLQFRGIDDQARNVELTLMEGVVVNENDFVTKQLTVYDSAKINSKLEVHDLIVTGKINTDNKSWKEISLVAADEALAKITQDWKQELIASVLLEAKTGIDFESVSIKGVPLVHGNKLNFNITESGIKSLGVLKNLSVEGEANIHQTLYVNRKRLGINTDAPEMALSVWDEEVSLIAGKIKDKQAYVGTSRAQTLSLGVNRTPYLEIDPDGLTSVKKIRIDKHRITFEPQVPGYSGTRGDLVFNSDPKAKTPFAWVCLGGFQWQALRSG